MMYGEYITVVDDYKKKSSLGDFSPALNNHLQTTLCKEKIILKKSINKPKTPLEEVLLWRLSLLSSEDE